MQEEWKGLVYRGTDYKNRFSVSNFGNIKNNKTGTVYKLQKSKTGYLVVYVSLGSRNNGILIRAHKAVAENFIENPQNLPQVNHIDGNKTNNHVTNLEWVTPSENMKHAIKIELLIPTKGEERDKRKLSNEDIIFIRNNYIPRDKNFGARALSRKFNVAHGTIEKIINKHKWKHLY